MRLLGKGERHKAKTAFFIKKSRKYKSSSSLGATSENKVKTVH